MKKIYEIPTVELVNLESVDVITASIPKFNDGNVLDDGWIDA